MKKRKLSYAKKRAARTKRHVIQRAQERYGITLEPRDIRRIAQKILANQSTPLARLSCSRSVHQVDLDGTPIQVMWDKIRHHVVTALPYKENRLER